MVPLPCEWEVVWGLRSYPKRFPVDLLYQSRDATLKPHGNAFRGRGGRVITSSASSICALWRKDRYPAAYPV